MTSPDRFRSIFADTLTPAPPEPYSPVPWWRRRRHTHRPIIGLCGPRGAGKTAYAVARLLPELRAGVTVASNARIRDPYTGAQPIHVDGWDECYGLSDAWLFLDEVDQWGPSREWWLLPAEARRFVAQSRHRGAGGVGLIVTFTSPGRVDKVLREHVDELYELRPVHPLIFPLHVVRKVRKTQAFVETGTLPAAGLPSLWWAPADTFDAYDDQEDIRALAHLLESSHATSSKPGSSDVTRAAAAIRARRYRERKKARAG